MASVVQLGHARGHRLFSGRFMEYFQRFGTVSTSSDHSSVEFHDKRVQEYISRINGIDFDTVFATRPGEASLPQFRLLTQEMVKREYNRTVEECKRLLTPPTLLSTVREEGGQPIERDPLLDRFDDSKWVFTDISMEIEDKDRYIVVREPEGTLRQATATERDRLCQTYAPKPGRKLWLPNLLTETELPAVLDRRHHVHVLDVVCVQCPVDSPDYIRVHDTVYEDISNKGLFSLLYCTRYYGGLVWYLLKRRHLEGIMEYMIDSQRLEEIEGLINLYLIVYPKEQGHYKTLRGEELITKFCTRNGYTRLQEKLSNFMPSEEIPAATSTN